MLGGWLIAVALHGTYDTAALMGRFYAAHHRYLAALALLLVPFVIVIAATVVVRGLWRRALADDDLASLRGAEQP